MHNSAVLLFRCSVTNLTAVMGIMQEFVSWHLLSYISRLFPIL